MLRNRLYTVSFII